MYLRKCHYVYDFTAVLANDSMKQTEDPKCAEAIATLAGDDIVNHFTPRIRQSGGWVCVHCFDFTSFCFYAVFPLVDVTF